MGNIEIFLIFTLAGTLILKFVLKFYELEMVMWKPFVACLASGLCAAFIPINAAGPISLVILLAVLKFVSDEPWESLWQPVMITRLALVPVLMLFGSW